MLHHTVKHRIKKATSAGNSLVVPLTKELKEMGVFDVGTPVHVASDGSFVLITRNEICDPIQHIVGIGNNLWGDVVSFSIKHRVRLGDVVKDALEFYTVKKDSKFWRLMMDDFHIRSKKKK